MGFFPRVAIQIIIILVAIGALLYWLSTMNLTGFYKNAEGGYAAYLVYVGRERLYAPEEGTLEFSEAKVSDTFPEGTRRIAVRLDAYHYSLGVKSPQVKIVVEKPGDDSWPARESLIDLPQNGCVFDRETDLVDGRPLEPGRYDVHFYIVQKAETPKDVHFKSIHFTVTKAEQ